MMVDGAATPPNVGGPDPDEPFPDDWLRRTVDEATAAERDALRRWTGPEHRAIQAALGGRAPLDDVTRVTIDLVDAALARSPLPRAARVRRITGAATFGVERAEDVAQTVGRRIDVAGYLATTIADNPPRMPGQQRVIVELLVPRGTPAAYLETVSIAPQQRELLLGRGLAILVTDAWYDQRMQRWIVGAIVTGEEVTR